MRYLAIVAFFFPVLLTAIEKPCPSVEYSRPWWGSNACRGDQVLELPIGVTGINLTHHSILPKGNFGFGTAAWAADVDTRIVIQNDLIALIRLGSGERIEFKRDTIGESWRTADVRLSEDSLTNWEKGYFLTTKKGATSYGFSKFADFFGVTSITDRNGNRTEIRRNPAGKIQSVLDSYGKTIRFEYDVAGRVKTILDIAGTANHFSYDELGRLIEVSLPDSTSYRLSYESATSFRVSSITSPNQSRSLYHYYPTGEIYAIVNPFNWVTKYKYTASSVQFGVDGQTNTEEVFAGGAVIRSKTDGMQVSYTLDEKKNVTSMTDEFGRVTNYTYGGAGRLRSSTDTDGVLSTYTYDAIGNLIAKTTGPISETWTYQPKFNFVLSHQVGKAKTTYQRDNRGNLLSLWKNGRLTFSAEYDPKGNVVKTIGETGDSTLVSYDLKGNIVSLSKGGKQLTAKYTALNQLKELRKGSDFHVFEHDTLGRVTRSSLVGPTGSVSATTSHGYSERIATNILDSHTKEAGLSLLPFALFLNELRAESEGGSPGAYVQSETVTTGTGSANRIYENSGTRGGSSTAGQKTTGCSEGCASQANPGPLQAPSN